MSPGYSQCEHGRSGGCDICRAKLDDFFGPSGVSPVSPARGVLLVRPIETAETMPGGRILLTADHRAALTAQQCEVVAVGAFAACDQQRSRAERKCARPHALDNCDGCPANPGTDNANRTDCCGRRVHPHDIHVGDWLLVAPRTYIAGPDPERPERFLHQDNVWGIFNETKP